VTSAASAAKSIGLKWRETNYLLLRRGPYLLAAGMDESVESQPHSLHGEFVNLFDAELRVQNDVAITPGSRAFLMDLATARTGRTHLLAAACRALPQTQTPDQINYTVEGVAKTPAIMLLEASASPKSVMLDKTTPVIFEYSAPEHLLRLHFINEAAPRELSVQF
jgi:hypothetical protein